MEDYKNKYEDLLDIIKNLYPNMTEYQQEKLQGVCPELAESEDEKIRKALKSYFDSEISDYGNVEWGNGIYYGEVIAWLEKQKEQKSIEWSAEDEKMRKELIEYHKIQASCGGHNAPFHEKYVSWLEKQKPTEEVNAEDYRIEGINTAIDILETTLGKVEGYQSDDGILEHKAAIAAVRKMKIQEPAIKPIFEIGDVMRTVDEAAKNITGGLPVVVSIDKKYYKCNNELIAIRDQYDYEYPPINKQQKPIEWSEEDEETIKEACKIINCYGNIITEQNEANKAYKIADKLKSLKPQLRQEWGDEDEDTCSKIIETIIHVKDNRNGRPKAHYTDSLLDEFVNWLKSIKDKCVPQKQEWSEGDEKMVESCLLFVNANRTHPLATKCIDWLKSLKPRSHWKTE